MAKWDFGGNEEIKKYSDDDLGRRLTAWRSTGKVTKAAATSDTYDVVRRWRKEQTAERGPNSQEPTIVPSRADHGVIARVLCVRDPFPQLGLARPTGKQGAWQRPNCTK